jgi:hypothetical protein
MSRFDAAVLAIRLAALYAWFQALEYVASGLISLFFAQSAAFGGTSAFATLLYILPCIAMILVGFLLFWRAPSLAHYFLPPAAVGQPPVTSPGPVVAFAIVGLAVFLYALPRVIGECVTLFQRLRFPGSDAQEEFLRALPALAANTVQLACGFALFVRPRKLAAWWRRRREIT